jgi:hypothetical protein
MGWIVELVPEISEMVPAPITGERLTAVIGTYKS